MDRRHLFLITVVALIIGCTSVPALAAPIVVVTSGMQRIQTFDSATPGVFSNDQLITGLLPGDSINAIDRRPSDGLIYGLTSNTDHIYTVDPATGVATFVSTAGLGASGNTGFDFNPVADSSGLPSLRVSGGLITGSTTQNVRIDVQTGATSTDAPFAFAPGDSNADVPPIVPALAYTNNFVGASSTSLYGLVSLPGGASVNPPVLVNVPVPAAGTMNTVGSLGVLNVNSLQGFDISTNGNAYAALGAPGGSQLFTINLSTGQASLVGTIGSGAPVVGLTASANVAAIPEPTTAFVLGTSLAVLAIMRRKNKKQVEHGSASSV
jgi:hypothetical protein